MLKLTMNRDDAWSQWAGVVDGLVVSRRGRTFADAREGRDAGDADIREVELLRQAELRRDLPGRADIRAHVLTPCGARSHRLDVALRGRGGPAG